jgi:hypothetical protein
VLVGTISQSVTPIIQSSFDFILSPPFVCVLAADATLKNPIPFGCLFMVFDALPAFGRS